MTIASKADYYIESSCLMDCKIIERGSKSEFTRQTSNCLKKRVILSNNKKPLY